MTLSAGAFALVFLVFLGVLVIVGRGSGSPPSTHHPGDHPEHHRHHEDHDQHRHGHRDPDDDLPELQATTPEDLADDFTLSREDDL